MSTFRVGDAGLNGRTTQRHRRHEPAAPRWQLQDPREQESAAPMEVNSYAQLNVARKRALGQNRR
jgi:hypothetical protein